MRARSRASARRGPASRTGRAALAIALWVALTLPGASVADWQIWPGPARFTPVIDFPRPAAPSPMSGEASSGRGVGQTFVARGIALTQLDIAVANQYDWRPGLLRLWRWSGSYQATVGEPPLFEDVVAFGGPPTWQTRSFFPHIVLQPGQTYFFEVTGAGRGPFSLLGDRDPGDAYPDGRARVGGGFPEGGESWDVWFRAFSFPRMHDPPPFPVGLEPRSARRWSPPLPERGSVSREDYRERYAAFADLVRASSLSGCGDKSHELAAHEAFLYRASCGRGACDEKYAANAIALLLRAYSWRFCVSPPGPPFAGCGKTCDPEPLLGSDWLEKAGTAYRWIADSPSLGPLARLQIRGLIVDTARRFFPLREIGTHNRALQGAAGLRLTATLFPDDRDSHLWRAHADSVWAEFWAARDSEEDSGSYTSGVWWPAVLAYAEASGLDAAVWSDPGFLGLVDRTFATIAPAGVPPDHGDSTGSLDSAAALVWLFERAATRTREPRFRWLAHRLFEFNRSRARDDPPRQDSLAQGMRYLGRAYLDADERLAPAPPPPALAASQLTTRAEARLRPKESWGGPQWRVYDLGFGRVPDKLVLRGGSGPDDLLAVFNLLAGYRHGQTELGALTMLMDGGSLLSAPTPIPYWQHTPLSHDESAPVLRRHRGGRYKGPGTRTELTHFKEAGRATIASLEWDDPEGWGVRVERRITFVKNRFLWIRDRFSFPDPIAAAVGTVWHAAELSSDHGESWYETFQREPASNIIKFRNPERYLMVYFVPRAGYESAAFAEPSYLAPADCPPPASVDVIEARCRSTAPYVLYQRWTGEARSGDSLWFDTLLVPYGPERTASQVASDVRVLLADGERAALEVRVGSELWTLAESPRRAPIVAPGLVTDARSMVLMQSPGQPGYLLARDARWVNAGSLLWRSSQPGYVETELTP